VLASGPPSVASGHPSTRFVPSNSTSSYATVHNKLFTGEKHNADLHILLLASWRCAPAVSSWHHEVANQLEVGAVLVTNRFVTHIKYFWNFWIPSASYN